MNERLNIMLAELESSRLEVMLVPLNPNKRGYNDGGCRRCACSRNVAWYRSFCLRHPSSRIRNRAKPDTRIKRRNVLRLLSRLAQGKGSVSKYAEELRRIAVGRAA